MDRCVEIRDPPHQHNSLEEERTPQSKNSRGAVRPPWPRVAAVLLTTAWNQSHLELQGTTEAPRAHQRHPHPTPSPLAAAAGQRRRMGKIRPAGRSARDTLPNLVGAPRTAPPLPLTTKAGQRRQRSSNSSHQRRSTRASPPPLTSTDGQRGRYSGKDPHLQEDNDGGFIGGSGGTLRRLQLRPSELEEGREQP
jgi:hypothetical protein